MEPENFGGILTTVTAVQTFYLFHRHLRRLTYFSLLKYLQFWTSLQRQEKTSEIQLEQPSL